MRGDQMGKKVVSNPEYKPLNLNKYEFFILKKIIKNDNYVSLNEIAREWVEETNKPAFRQYFHLAYKKLEELYYIKTEKAESVYLYMYNREVFETFKTIFYYLEKLQYETSKNKKADAEKLLEKQSEPEQFKRGNEI